MRETFHSRCCNEMLLISVTLIAVGSQLIEVKSESTFTVPAIIAVRSRILATIHMMNK